MSRCSNSDCTNTKSRAFICNKCGIETKFCSNDCLVRHNFDMHQSMQDSIKPRNTSNFPLSKPKKLSSISDPDQYFYYKNFNVVKKGPERVILKKSDSYELIVVRSKIDNKIYSMKIVYKSKITSFKRIKSEIRTHIGLDHNNIVRLFGYSENGDNIYIVLEYSAKGCLDSLFGNDIKEISQETLKSYTKCVVNSINFLYTSSVAHNNINASNFLIFENGVLKLWEFNYCEDNQHTNAADIWAAGLLIFQMTQGKSLLEEVSPDLSLNRLQQIMIGNLLALNKISLSTMKRYGEVRLILPGFKASLCPV